MFPRTFRCFGKISSVPWTGPCTQALRLFWLVLVLSGATRSASAATSTRQYIYNARIGMGTQGVVPLTLVTCLLLLTGDIYYKTVPGAPQQVWGKANKFAAAFILVANIAWLNYLASVVAWRVEETAAASPVANPVLPAPARTPIMTDTSLVPARDEVADRLSVSAVKLNAAIPTMVDKETRLDFVSASGRTLTLNYTMVERSSETVTTEQITTGQSRRFAASVTASSRPGLPRE